MMGRRSAGAIAPNADSGVQQMPLEMAIRVVFYVAGKDKQKSEKQVKMLACTCKLMAIAVQMYRAQVSVANEHMWSEWVIKFWVQH